MLLLSVVLKMKFKHSLTHTFSTKFFAIFQWKKYNPDNRIIKYSSETKVEERKWIDKSGEVEKKREQKNIFKPKYTRTHVFTHTNKQTNTILVQL